MTKDRSTEVEVREPKRSKYRKGRRYENGLSTEKVELMRTLNYYTDLLAFAEIQKSKNLNRPLKNSMPILFFFLELEFFQRSESDMVPHGVDKYQSPKYDMYELV